MDCRSRVQQLTRFRGDCVPGVLRLLSASPFLCTSVEAVTPSRNRRTSVRVLAESENARRAHRCAGGGMHDRGKWWYAAALSELDLDQFENCLRWSQSVLQ